MTSAERFSKTGTCRFRMLGFSGLLGGLFLLLASAYAKGAEYFVAPNGSDSNPGTMALPFASMQKGHDVAAAGDTIWLRGGTYKPTGFSSVSGISISKSGASDTNRIKFWAYAGEIPIIDFSSWKSSGSAKANGIYLTGNWIHLRGLEIANIPQQGTFTNSGVLSTSSNNTYELLNIHNIGGPGLFISGGNGGNLILNCDSHDNYDPKSSQGDGQNADGFGVHYQSTGPSTIIRGCRAWWNSDDGYDLISQEVPVTIDGCWAMGSGTSNMGTGNPGSGNGNGFKAGSSKTGIRHTVKNCVAWKNGAAGFYANHSSGGNNWYNNTSLNNGTQYNMLASPSGDTSMTITLTGALAHKMRNNIGFPDKNSNMGGVDTMFNTWDLKITPSNNDFVGVADTGFNGPRQADGSLPALDFMKLKAGSQMIDKGTDVGTKFAGAAPDLGAYEYGTALPGIGGASASGSGGNSGAAGSTAAGTGGSGSGGAGMVATGGGNSASGGGSGTGGGGAGAIPGTGGATSSGTGGSLPGTGGSFGASGGGHVATGGQAGSMMNDPVPAGCACSIGVTWRRAPLASLPSVLAALWCLVRSRRRQRPRG